MTKEECETGTKKRSLLVGFVSVVDGLSKRNKLPGSAEAALQEFAVFLRPNHRLPYL